MQVTAFVSAVDSDGFYMQDSPTADLSQGIFVYTGTDGYGLDGREVGEEVQVTSVVYEYYGLTELDLDGTDGESADVTSLSTGATMVPYETTTGAIGEECSSGGEEYEGLLVILSDVEIVGEPNDYGETSIDDGSGVTQLEDGLLDTDDHLAELLGTDTLTGQMLTSITGVVHYSYSSFEVHPRTADDIVIPEPEPEPEPSEACAPEDLDASGQVDFQDLVIVLSNWGQGGNSDLDGDGVTSFQDLIQILSLWGTC